MFGRDKTSTSTPPTRPAGAGRPADGREKAGGKGRPTPSRREAEQRNRRPLIGAAAPVGATRAERRAARKARSAQARSERTTARQAMAQGEERALPLRDKGPARRFTRDYVDARRNAGEYFLPVAGFAVVASFVRIPAAQFGSLVVLYSMVVVIGVDMFLLRRRVNRLTTERFGVELSRGCGGYAVMRALQLRRARLPRVQVKRGESPVKARKR